MRWSVIASLVLALAAACGSSDEPTPSDPAGSPSVSTSSPTVSPIPEQVLDEAACPAADVEFCETATRIGRALIERDAAMLLKLSRSTAIRCEEVAQEYFPGCDDAEDLAGYGLSGADFIVDVVPEADYAARLDEVVAGIDPSFSDGLGGGAPTVIGVGTCGPDIPGRRTYHLAWTAAIAADGRPAERYLGSFEMTFEDGRWRTALWYLDPLEDWEAEQPDPMTLAFCEAGFNPWGN